MNKLNQAQEQTMEEILASIRRMIADDSARGAAPRPGPEPARPPANISRLFAETSGARPLESAPVAPVPQPVARNVIEMAMDLAIEDGVAEADAEMSEDGPPLLVARGASAPQEQPLMRGGEAPASFSEPDASRTGPPLMSARTDAAVASAFGQLATTMLPGSARTIDELVEDMLRPMLRGWLDANLPLMVERLVREEIERVSRGRR